MKALLVLRVSTESQEIESQKAELIPFAAQYGYKESDLVYVEAIGASAIKLDQKYMDMANKVKELILAGGIDCVFVWEISRLGRNEVILMDFKEFFIKHKVQFICKTPSLKLLDDDGNVNTGTELAFSLFATMAKQEMQEKKSRFARAKRSMAKKGQYIGGNTRPYGYSTEGIEFVVNEDEAKIIRLIFELYSTGQYSGQTLAKELQERGYNFNDRQVVRIFANKAYTGEPVGELGVHYPQIISKELFDRCAEIRQSNKIDMRRGTRIVLGSKLVKCFKCGATCTCNTRHYVCCKAAHKSGCDNGYALRKDVVDDLLWRVAFVCHMDYLLDLDGKKKKEYKKELKVVREKIAASEKKTGEFNLKKERILESYMDGLIDRRNRDYRLSKLADDLRVHLEAESSLRAKEGALVGMLEDHLENTEEAVIAALEKMDTEDKFQVIHRHIQSVVGKPLSYGVRDKRTHRPNAVEITVTSVYGQDYRYMYFPKYYKGSNLYVWNGREWKPDWVTKV